MSFAKVYSAQTSLLSPYIVTVEVDLSKGIYAFSIVGLPDKGVEEARDRIAAAIKNSGYDSPKSRNQKIVVSLAPADIKKEGPSFDLAIAIAYLRASGDIRFDPEKKIFLGELSLDGELRYIDGVLPLIQEAKKHGFTEVYLPKENAKEAALIDNISVYGASTLIDVIHHLNVKRMEDNSARLQIFIPKQEKTKIVYPDKEFSIDFSDIKGQETAKRGLEIAAAGGHNIAMYGPPGTGKTMLAKAFCHILPPLNFDEILETTAIHSVAGVLKNNLVTEPPLRAPHHTASYTALVGGGTTPKPGEVTLAHRGVLFLDEFPEFDRRVIEALRQPLEDRTISISRIKGTAHFPADFILIATMNPCPCGNHGAKDKECTCTPFNLMRYQRKISGPIIDRIDLWIEVGSIDHRKLSDIKSVGEKTDAIKTRVLKARQTQELRFKKLKRKINCNSQMSARELEQLISLSDSVKNILNTSATKLGLSARAYHRIIKLARTIADLASSIDINESHIAEAIQYRPRQINN
ncbi:MAG: ATP-binding protein [Candidatus Taylorbacteria bacterium]|nr:ATP-binding protein [Candidatus Taylorbacteria bacterium]